MKRPLRGDMPLALTLPLHFDLGLRTRRRRLRRVLITALAITVAALLAAGMWFPARAALNREAASGAYIIDARDPQLTPADLAVGATFTLRRYDGALHSYEVIALDIVDSRRVDLTPDSSGRIVTLATPWPFDGEPVPGQWHYVVTGRLRF
jgi:hypothetical protein